MLRREAAGWLARLQSGRDPEVERKFERWLQADPRNSESFERVRRSYDQAGLLRHSSVSTPEPRQPASSAPGWAPLRALAAAAALFVVLPVGLRAWRDGRLPFAATNSLMLMTKVGEIRQVRLADGSRVTLDTATRLDVEIGGSLRRAHLRYGRARFEVAQGSAPFTVETAGAAVTTSEGVVDVDEAGGQGLVQVVAGAAAVRGAEQGAQVALREGEGVTVDPGGTLRKAAMPPAPDWTGGMLQFDGTPLGEAVALANRYSEHHIVIAGDLAGLRVTGAFRAGDTAGLARALGAAFALALRERPDGALMLSRSGPPAAQNKKGG